MYTWIRSVASLPALLLACAALSGCPGEKAPAPDSSAPAPAPSKTPAAGDEVVAEWSQNSFYEGKVESVAAGKAKVAWADGSSPSEVELAKVFMKPAAGHAPSIEKDGYVLAKWGTGTKWYGAKVTGPSEGKKVPIRYTSDGSSDTVEPEKILNIPEALVAGFKQEEELNTLVREAKAAGKPAKPSGWKPKADDAVISLWGTSWYTGKVKSVSGNKVTVAWDDGSDPTENDMADVAPVPTADSKDMPKAGSYVIVKSGTRWQYARVESAADGKLSVKVEDGSDKTVAPGEFLGLK